MIREAKKRAQDGKKKKIRLGEGKLGSTERGNKKGRRTRQRGKLRGKKKHTEGEKEKEHRKQI